MFWQAIGETVPKSACAWAIVKDMQTSKMTKPTDKCMMKISMKTSAAALILLFEKAVDRDQAKDTITKMIAPYKSRLAPQISSKSTTKPKASTAPAESRRRTKVLAADPKLAQRYTELVKGGVITEQEFWTQKECRTRINAERWKGQKTGESNALMADLRSSSSSSQMISYSLNAKQIHSIFVQYPAVHRAFQDKVPNELTEKEFWLKYVQSRFFHRDRGRQDAGASGVNSDDLFTPYDTGGDQLPRQESAKGGMLRGEVDPLMDLTSTDGDMLRVRVHDIEAKTKTSVPAYAATKASIKEAQAAAVINKLNRHAFLVLDPPAGANTAQSSNDIIQVTGVGGGLQLDGLQLDGANGAGGGRVAGADAGSIDLHPSVTRAVQMPDLQSGKLSHELTSDDFIPLKLRKDPRKAQDNAAALAQSPTKGFSQSSMSPPLPIAKREPGASNNGAAKPGGASVGNMRSSSPGLKSKLSCFAFGDDDDDEPTLAATSGGGGGGVIGSSSRPNDGCMRQSSTGQSLQLKPKIESSAGCDRQRTWPALEKGFPTPTGATGVLRGMMMMAARAQGARQQQADRKPDMPFDFERQLMEQHYSVTELLRHHYSNSQHRSTEARESKLQRINIKLESKLKELGEMKQILRQDSS
jgi:hypothetical protein